ncbi:hypothetical protein TELCIR_06549 [Teladorsagia circumcincta]|uniref:Uncharacterized protein n=1 Tax=Teladorsagia circumcincta TaxID=45464 RepID=A0A2G9UQ11_TELCI|nr:hypothetical protein TELCIR_06549 [Teladorsagia circumcincta]
MTGLFPPRRIGRERNCSGNLTPEEMEIKGRKQKQETTSTVKNRKTDKANKISHTTAFINAHTDSDGKIILKYLLTTYCNITRNVKQYMGGCIDHAYDMWRSCGLMYGDAAMSLADTTMDLAVVSRVLAKPSICASVGVPLGNAVRIFVWNPSAWLVVLEPTVDEWSHKVFPNRPPLPHVSCQYLKKALMDVMPTAQITVAVSLYLKKMEEENKDENAKDEHEKDTAEKGKELGAQEETTTPTAQVQVDAEGKPTGSAERQEGQVSDDAKKEERLSEEGKERQIDATKEAGSNEVMKSSDEGHQKKAEAGSKEEVKSMEKEQADHAVGIEAKEKHSANSKSIEKSGDGKGLPSAEKTKIQEKESIGKVPKPDEPVKSQEQISAEAAKRPDVIEKEKKTKKAIVMAKPDKDNFDLGYSRGTNDLHLRRFWAEG